jgi:hypothetical protein
MEEKSLTEDTLAWVILYLGMLVGGLLVVGLLSLLRLRNQDRR